MTRNKTALTLVQSNACRDAQTKPLHHRTSVSRWRVRRTQRGTRNFHSVHASDSRCDSPLSRALILSCALCVCYGRSRFLFWGECGALALFGIGFQEGIGGCHCHCHYCCRHWFWLLRKACLKLIIICCLWGSFCSAACAWVECTHSAALKKTFAAAAAVELKCRWIEDCNASTYWYVNPCWFIIMLLQE